MEMPPQNTMSARACNSPISTCAERLPEPERTRFLHLLRESRQMLGRAATLRRRAWRLYRDEILARAGELNSAGLELAQIARQLDMSERALRRLLDRAAREKYGRAGGAS